MSFLNCCWQISLHDLHIQQITPKFILLLRKEIIEDCDYALITSGVIIRKMHTENWETKWNILITLFVFWNHPIYHLSLSYAYYNPADNLKCIRLWRQKNPFHEIKCTEKYPFKTPYFSGNLYFRWFFRKKQHWTFYDTEKLNAKYTILISTKTH